MTDDIDYKQLSIDLLTECKILRQRVDNQRRELARLSAHRDKAWECDDIKVQSWRVSEFGGVATRYEKFVVKGRRALGVLRGTSYMGDRTEWVSAFGAGIASNRAEAIKQLVQHDTVKGAIKAGEQK